MEPVARAPRPRAARAGTTSCRSRRSTATCCPHDSVKGSQVLEPLFEFSGACAGCGETPYLKLVSQLFGDRMIVANATGCSSIYGGNLPTTPWTTNADGRGPAWSNSLFEDNAEFGLGHAPRPRRPGATRPARCSTRLAAGRRRRPGAGAARQPPGDRGRGRRPAAACVAELATGARAIHGDARTPTPRSLPAVAGNLVRQGVWIIGGDGWAYDIGFGGLDHVLSSGPQRQHPRARHRGVLQHRRPGVQGDAPRRGGQVRRGRQGHRRRRTSARSPAPTATSTSPRSRWAPTTCRRPRRCSRRTPGRARRWSSPTAPASPTASTCPSR